MDKIRTFLAVRLSARTKSALSGIEKQLISAGADVKWVSKENFHITLKFLGDTDTAMLDAITEAVEQAIGHVEPFEAVLSGVGVFPDLNRPSVIWVGIISGGEQLKTLANGIEKALEPLGFAREKRGFTPHITIGRTRSMKNVDRLQESISALKNTHVDSVSVDSVALVQSTLKPSGSVYTVLREIALKR